MSALYPDVPVALGVPAVLRRVADMQAAQSALLTADNATPVSSNDWGVFDQSGSRLLNPDNIVSVEYGGEHRISDYPTENGGFQSYNKVAAPFEVRLAMSKGGSVTDRTAFLNTIETLHGSLDVVDVATPERVYVGVNLTRVAQVRSPQSGAGMAVVEMTLQEVRQTVVITYTKSDPVIAPTSASVTPLTKPAVTATKTPNTPAIKQPKTPASTPTKSIGSVQARPITQSGNAARVQATPSGRRLFIYDKPIGS